MLVFLLASCVVWGSLAGEVTGDLWAGRQSTEPVLSLTVKQ